MGASRAARALLFVLGLVAVAGATWHLALLAQIFAARIDYPMDLEWMEGGALLHSHRFLRGEPVYGPPSQGFLPYPYPPAHFALMALVGSVTGLDYTTGRAVSIASFALVCGVLFAEAARSSWRRNKLLGLSLGLGAVGAAACSFPVVGGWYDVVRNDSLAIALPVLGAALVSGDRPSRGRLFASAVVFTAAVYTKQTAAFFIAWVGLFLLVRRYPRGIFFGFVTAVLGGAVLVSLQLATDGRFWIYTVRNLARHQVRVAQAIKGAWVLLEFAPFLVLIPVLLLVARRRRWVKPNTVLWTGMLCVAFPVALLPFAKGGGYLNNLIPVAVLSGPVFVLLLGDVLRGLRASPRARYGVQLAVVVLAAAFFVRGHYDKDRFIPSAELRKNADALNAYVASLQGGVLIPAHPFLAVRNGQTTPQLHEMAYRDARHARMRGLDFPGFLARTRARWVILSGLEEQDIRGWVHQLYKPRSKLGIGMMVKPLTGSMSRPTELLELREPIIKRSRRALFDFDGGLDGWQITGNAFELWASDETNKRLTSFPSTLARKDRDGAQGEAISPVFTVDRDLLGFLIGGGKSKGLSVELRVDGQKVASSVGLQTNMLSEVTWDVRRYQGKTARLAVIDHETTSWGHIVIDDVELFDLKAQAR